MMHEHMLCDILREKYKYDKKCNTAKKIKKKDKRCYIGIYIKDVHILQVKKKTSKPNVINVIKLFCVKVN